jgi:RimJ/RimL family protein N-acetyltransferase
VARRGEGLGAFVGDCGLVPKEIEGVSEVDLVYVLVPRAWGKGYATEIGSALLRFAMEELGRRRVVCVIDPKNDASQRVAGKLGFHRQTLIKRPDGVDRELWVIEVSGGGLRRRSS